jgi:magnesium transporter
MREVVNTVMRRASEDDHDAELTPDGEDLYDHMLRAAEWTGSLGDIISSIFETNLSLADARMDTVMKKLRSWAAIIAVPTAITGYFGQNLPYPGFANEWGFALSIASMLLITGALWVPFKGKDWHQPGCRDGPLSGAFRAKWRGTAHHSGESAALNEGLGRPRRRPGSAGCR